MLKKKFKIRGHLYVHKTILFWLGKSMHLIFKYYGNLEKCK